MKVQTAYDKQKLHLEADSPYGDKARVVLPVKLARKLLRTVGKLPVALKGMNEAEWIDLMNTMAECLDGEMTGEIISIDRADGTRIRVFVE